MSNRNHKDFMNKEMWTCRGVEDRGLMIDLMNLSSPQSPLMKADLYSGSISECDLSVLEGEEEEKTSLELLEEKAAEEHDGDLQKAYDMIWAGVIVDRIEMPNTFLLAREWIGTIGYAKVVHERRKGNVLYFGRPFIIRALYGEWLFSSQKEAVTFMEKNPSTNLANMQFVSPVEDRARLIYHKRLGQAHGQKIAEIQEYLKTIGLDDLAYSILSKTLDEKGVFPKTGRNGEVIEDWYQRMVKIIAERVGNNIHTTKLLEMRNFVVFNSLFEISKYITWNSLENENVTTITQKLLDECYTRQREEGWFEKAVGFEVRPMQVCEVGTAEEWKELQALGIQEVNDRLDAQGKDPMKTRDDDEDWRKWSDPKKDFMREVNSLIQIGKDKDLLESGSRLVGDEYSHAYSKHEMMHRELDAKERRWRLFETNLRKVLSEIKAKIEGDLDQLLFDQVQDVLQVISDSSLKKAIRMIMPEKDGKRTTIKGYEKLVKQISDFNPFKTVRYNLRKELSRKYRNSNMFDVMLEDIRYLITHRDGWYKAIVDTKEKATFIGKCLKANPFPYYAQEGAVVMKPRKEDLSIFMKEKIEISALGRPTPKALRYKMMQRAFKGIYGDLKWGTPEMQEFLNIATFVAILSSHQFEHMANKIVQSLESQTKLTEKESIFKEFMETHGFNWDIKSYDPEALTEAAIALGKLDPQILTVVDKVKLEGNTLFLEDLTSIIETESLNASCMIASQLLAIDNDFAPLLHL